MSSDLVLFTDREHIEAPINITSMSRFEGRAC